MSRRTSWLLAGVAVIAGAAALPAQNGDVGKALRALRGGDADAYEPAERRALVRTVLADPERHRALEDALDARIAVAVRDYADALDEPIRAAYIDRLRSLEPAELREVARVRRVWRNYVLQPSTQLHFQQHFLEPATAVGQLLLPDVALLGTKASAAVLRRMRELDGYRTLVREAQGLGEDPTAGRKAPTGIPLPPLDRPRGFEEFLDHLHRSLAVASSVAAKGARDILLDNAVQARFIDFEEAEFVLYSNEIRALMGVVAWSTDVLACAATRDHSKDRVEGNAKGHWSSLPGKRGFVDRLRRFGTGGTSEGAGGGNSGRRYLHGLSYGGGHTGPLYSMQRNQVGVGRFGNCYTSTYGKNGGKIHSCQASEGELFMPPGIGPSDIASKSLEGVYQTLLFENYVGAEQLLDEAKAKTAPDKFLRKYLAIAIDVEADWQIECLRRYATVGDLLAVEHRIATIRGMFGDSLDQRLRPFEKRLATRAAADVLAAGRDFEAACKSADQGAFEVVTTAHPETVYAQAAQHYLAAEQDKHKEPRSWFLTVDPYLARFEFMNPR